MFGNIFCIEPFRHPKVFNLFENLRFARFSALSRRCFFTLWLYMPRHPTFGMATPSIILIPVVEGIGPCPPACDRQSPAPPPSTTFACTHRDAPGRSHFASDPCLSLRLYELDKPPFFFASGSSRLHKNYYYHSCRSLILGAWELWICFGEIKGFGAFRLHYTRCAFRRSLDIGCLRHFASAQRRGRRASAKRSSHLVCPSFLCLRHWQVVIRR
jgi:hypothetical protein